MRFDLPVLPPALWTVGHSTLSIEAFLANLAAARIEAVADVRRHAGSRRYPQFNPDALAQSLRGAGVDYVPMPALGGRRKPRPDSSNTNWRNDSFRGYADYMETPAFRSALAALAGRAAAQRTSVMCAEAVWWRCHRGLIADAFVASGTPVWNIGTDGRVEAHPFTSAARLVDGELTYGGTLPLC